MASSGYCGYRLSSARVPKKVPKDAQVLAGDEMDGGGAEGAGGVGGGGGGGRHRSVRGALGRPFALTAIPNSEDLFPSVYTAVTWRKRER
jgi:hypothetical protein